MVNIQILGMANDIEVIRILLTLVMPLNLKTSLNRTSLIVCQNGFIIRYFPLPN